MDAQSKHAIKLIHALANVKSQFNEFMLRISSRFGVIRVLNSIESVAYLAHSVIEGYVDVELHNGKCVAWLLEIGWDNTEWTIESRVVLNDNVPFSTQETMKEFPIRTAKTLDECIEQLLQAVSDLLGDADSIIESLTA